ncbi:MAG: Tfx family DNA-binding protein [Salinirussus sp.]
MVDASATVLTERQVEVLELRATGLTQAEVADQLNTTVSNISGIERAAEDNVEKARRTLELVEGLRAATHLEIPAGTGIEEAVAAVYERGDEAGIEIAYARPELSARLFEQLEGVLSDGALEQSIKIGLTDQGEVFVVGQ